MTTKSDTSTLRILRLSASARRDGSISRTLSQDLIDALEQRHGEIELVHRDLRDGVSFVHEQWIEANFAPDETRTEAQRSALADSDALVHELMNADALVIGVPMYNFGVPAVLKAWIDMIARPGLTFRYTEHGPVGLVHGKRAYIVVTSGGVPVGSAVDFLTPYLQQALRFIGIEKIDVVAADQLNNREADSIDSARVRIADIVHGVDSTERHIA